METMKFRYLKITGSVIWGTNTITRDDLVRVKNRSYDAVIDLQNMTTFNADTNSWDEIKGDL